MAIADDQWHDLVLLADAATMVSELEKNANVIAGKKRKSETPIGGSSSSSSSPLSDEESPTKIRRLVFKFSAKNGQNNGDDPALKISFTPRWLIRAKKKRTTVGKKRAMASFSASSSSSSASPSSSSSPSTSGYNPRKMKPRAPTVSKAPGDQRRGMPDALRDKIAGEGGGEFVLVVQKQLYATDVNKNNNRLSMPPRELQARPEEFLQEDERLRLTEKAGLAVKVVDEEHRAYMLALKQWKMGPNVVYNLISHWNSVVENNALRRDDVVQLWAFRRQGNELGFAIVRVNNVSSDEALRDGDVDTNV